MPGVARPWNLAVLALLTLAVSFSVDSCSTFAGHQAEREAREQAEREKLRWWLNVVTKWYECTWFVVWLCCSLRQYVCHSTGARLRAQLDANSIRTLQDTWDLKGNMSCSHCMRFGSGYKAKHWYQRFAKHWMTPWRAAFFWRAMTWWHAKSYLPKFGYRFSYSIWSCLICLAILSESLRPWCVTTTTCWGTIDTQTYTIRIGQLISMPWPLRVKCLRVITRPKRNALQNHILGRFVLILTGCNRILGWIAFMRRLLIAKFSSSTTLPTMVVAERRPIHYLLRMVGKNAKSKARIPAVKAWRSETFAF